MLAESLVVTVLQTLSTVLNSHLKVCYVPDFIVFCLTLLFILFVFHCLSDCVHVYIIPVLEH